MRRLWRTAAKELPVHAHGGRERGAGFEDRAAAPQSLAEEDGGAVRLRPPAKSIASSRAWSHLVMYSDGRVRQELNLQPSGPSFKTALFLNLSASNAGRKLPVNIDAFASPRFAPLPRFSSKWQTVVAAVLGTSAETLQNREQGRRSPTRLAAIQIWRHQSRRTHDSISRSLNDT